MFLVEYIFLKKFVKKEYIVKCYKFSYLDYLYIIWYIEIVEVVFSRFGYYMGFFFRILYISDFVFCICGSFGKWGYIF